MAVKAYNTITLIRVDDAVWEIIDGHWYKNGVNQGIKAQGEDGLDGLSAYELAVIGGYEGTETEFNDELARMKDIRDTIQNGGHNILKNPRFGGTELPDAGHWYSGGTVAGYLDWYGYLTVDEFLNLYGHRTIEVFLMLSLMGGLG